MRSPWMVALVSLIAVAAWAGLVVSLVWPIERSPFWFLVLMAVLFGVGLPWLMLRLQLHTTVDATGLHVHFRPRVGGHDFALADITSVKAITYRPIRQFGGWGVRWGRGGSRALSVSGDSAVEVVERGGRRWVIGTQRPGELAAALRAFDAPTSEAS